jgi:DNA modification methylase
MSPREFLNGRVVLHPGDCMEILPTLEAESVDSAVTDPPYHLTSIVKRFGKEDSAPAQFGTNGAFARASRGFMGKQWDGGDIAFRLELWAEVLRVLKPGGHLLAFSGSRTYHRMACAIEDAGFEIRDQIMWLYSQGFPKSHNLRNNPICSCEAEEDDSGTTEISEHNMRSVRYADIPAAVDSANERGKILLPRLPERGPPAHRTANAESGNDGREESGMERRELHRARQGVSNGPQAGSPESTGKWLRAGAHSCGGIDTGTSAQTGGGGSPQESGSSRQSPRQSSHLCEPPRTLDGRALCGRGACSRCGKLKKEFEGFGTALKPSHEPLVLARKPLIGTVAENVLAHGTGALNVDGCRIGTDGGMGKVAAQLTEKQSDAGWGTKRFIVDDTVRGRFPANVIHDGSDEVEGAFAAFGECSGAIGMVQHASGTNRVLGKFNRTGLSTGGAGLRDSGTASRFFYTAKADTKDRLGSSHPTIKPLDLIQYLVRLITPPGGTVLDLFAGTGTTGEAAFREGMRAILIEREAEYQADIERRMGLVYANDRDRKATADRVRNKPRVDRYTDTGSLF